MLALYVKVTHSNQTLILASERRGQGAKSDNTLDQAVNAASKGGVLARVTIVAAQPDKSVVYVHADYANAGAAGSAQAQPGSNVAATDAAVKNLPALRPAASSRVTNERLSAATTSWDSRDAYGNPRYGTSDGTSSTYLKPTEQYARTQRNTFHSPLSSLIDVLA